MSVERETNVPSGWLMLLVLLALTAGGVALFLIGVLPGTEAQGGQTNVWALAFGLALLLAASLIIPGFFTLQPNEARVLILFGSYKGTTRQTGFRWGNPFYSNGPGQGTVQLRGVGFPTAEAKKPGKPSRGLRRYKVSLRARTLNGDRLKVNDRRGNPVEIAAVVVWRVADTAQAVFDVDDYEQYVATQSESALRHVASAYAYDHGTGDETSAEITLRSNVVEVSQALQNELEQRLAKAGVTVDEARLTHLAYAPEIAQAMLRRQQAEAIIAARQKIVAGAVGMVDMALRELSAKQVVSLDDERKATMVSNLMVVLCGESEVHPVVNAGTLYQ